jgi:hypothetical protein
VQWMLENGTPEAKSFLTQLENAEVTPWKCQCGCASFTLQIRGMELPPPGVHILGDFIFGPEDGPAGIFVFASNAILSGVEVYGLASDAPSQLPEPESLRPFDSAVAQGG